MNFEVYGPFEIPKTDTGLVTRAAKEKREFWTTVDATREGISEACGAYVFAIQSSGGGAKPWYVGMTQKLGFRKECFQPHKVILYNEALAEYDRAHPHLYLIAKLTSSRVRFAKPSRNGHADIDALEDVLIGIAYSRNENLLNIRGTKFLKKAVIPGVMNSPQGNWRTPARALRKVLGL